MKGEEWSGDSEEVIIHKRRGRGCVPGRKGPNYSASSHALEHPRDSSIKLRFFYVGSSHMRKGG